MMRLACMKNAVRLYVEDQSGAECLRAEWQNVREVIAARLKGRIIGKVDLFCQPKGFLSDGRTDTVYQLATAWLAFSTS